MTVQGILAQGRERITARFTETISFTREGTEPDANNVPNPVETIVYAGVPGQVKFASQAVSNREQGAQLVAVQQRIVKVAVGSVPEVREGDFAMVTASTVDPGLVGRKFHIGGTPDSGQVTSWRFPVSEVS